jgi:pyruvate/2-oxoglutarate dehydrogenase complex dihydrolipoamide acyltransferase (E2) component
MKLTKARIGSLAALGIVLAAFAVDRVFLSSETTAPRQAHAASEPLPPAPKAAPAPAVQAPAEPAAGPARPSAASRLKALAGAENLDIADFRDAFVPAPAWLAQLKTPEPPVHVQETDEAQEFAQRHTLTAVFVIPGGGGAIVNGKTVSVGEELDGFRLVRLSPNSALFQGAKDQVEVSLPPPTRRQ